MRGIDLQRFDFDYDLTWAGFFLNSDGKILGRFGGRDGHEPDRFLTLSGLKHAMSAALKAHANRADPLPAAEPDDRYRQPEAYPAAKRLKASDCIHCHQVYNFRQDWHYTQRTWSRERIWVYPPPDNLGFSLDPEMQNRVTAVKPESPAATAGLKAGDVLQSVNKNRVASFADVQYALHRAPATGPVRVEWQRGDEKKAGELKLPENWRESDISWRTSMWNLEPAASVYGQDLSAKEKEKLGLGPKRLAFRQGNYVPPAARDAGIRADDIILGIDGKELEMTMLQFNVYVRLNFHPGDRITFNVIRGGKILEFPMKLPKKAP